MMEGRVVVEIGASLGSAVVTTHLFSYTRLLLMVKDTKNDIENQAVYGTVTVKLA